MPLNCGIVAGMDITCDDLRKPGGLFKDVWVFNIDDLRLPIAVGTDSYLTSLELDTYRLLYKFSSTKYSHEATWTEQTGEGGNKSYRQQVTLRLFNSNPTDDAVIEDLGVSNVGVIVKTNAGEFLIYGAETGLTSDGSTGGSGRNGTDTTTSSIVLVGDERFLPKRLLIGGSAANTQIAIDAMTA